MHATLTIALQSPPPTQQQLSLTAPRTFADSLETLTRKTRSVNSGSSYNDSGMKLANNQTPCKSMDIRNHISALDQLANCTIIEGFLLITLINDADKLNRTYPLLTEVTGYIVVFRVSNLQSLSQIFPNLSVIRGNILFESYALVLYQNRDLLDIGLSNLRAISNGGVRIEKNSYLCFIKTVNWREIMSKNSTDADLVVKFNRNEAECARCPGENNNVDGQDNVGPEGGDVRPCKEYPGGKRYCWNSRSCQIICPKECPYNCIDENNCCDKSCLGSCSKAMRTKCVACRNYSINNGTCIDKCPDTHYVYEQRCITAAMCRQINTKYENSKQMKLLYYNGKCTTRCEKGYEVKSDTCQKCNGTCHKLCEGGLIDSLVRAKEYHGCTVIGPNEGLTINIKRGGPYMIDALESGLGAVHTINSFLKVHLTYGLTSLDFFKSLRSIQGIRPIEGRYALYVLENRDLESIWGPNQTVMINNGSVFFHFNPKLCLEVIEKLKPMLPNTQTFNKNEVAEDSNGNKGKCNTLKLDVKINSTDTGIINIYINNTMAQFLDPRSFIGFQYYYTLDPYGNVTRDNYQPCVDNWVVSDPSKDTLITIYSLKPYTKYAFYVRTMTISSEKLNYQSDIIRFRTLAAQPSIVRRISARSKDSSKILLSWKPPSEINGKLVKYQVRAELTRRDGKLEHHRNFCRDPLPNAVDEEETFASPADKAAKEVPVNDCNCEAGGRSTFDSQTVEEKILDEIEFEDALHNFLYVSKKTKTSQSESSVDAASSMANSIQKRSRRFIEIDEQEQHMGSVLMRSMRSVMQDKAESIKAIKSNVHANATVVLNDAENWINMTQKDLKEDFYTILSAEVPANTTEFLFENLRHFSVYLLTVRACREKEPGNNRFQECSKAEPWDKRTKKKAHADTPRNLVATLVTNVNSTRGSDVRLRWEEPLRPNGAIVSYLIVYQRQEKDSAPDKKCITVQDYLNQSGYVLQNLNEGTYTIQVRANSLAGEGDFSNHYDITVPPPGLSTFALIAICVGSFLLAALLLSCGSYYVVRKKTPPQDLVINTEVNPFYASLQYVPDDWEVPRERIIQLGPLGQGSFGMVYEGILKSQNAGDDTPCAIKTVNENATDRERTNFLSEASVMKEFDTYHVVRLLGVCSRGQPALVVMELMKKGDLKSYLRAHRPDEREDVLAVYQQRIGLTSGTGTGGAVQPPPYSRIYQMAIEIADGMAYLSAKKFVHRDLAARNCMVAADLTVKIGDFGMTRDIYETDYYRKGTKGLLPVRWMPPESLRDGVHASSSDVFSYGVVLWEMATLASQPYQGLSNEQVLRYVIDGGIMERPDNCPDILHKLMHRCWHHRPTARPSFLDIIAYLEHLADPHFKEVAFYYSEQGLKYREKERKERNQMDAFAGGGQLDAVGDADADDSTTPLRVGEYTAYKSNMEHNTSLDQPAESPIANLVDDQATTTHSPFSLHSGFIVSSTPDALSTLPTAGGSHMEDAAYVQPDPDAAHTADAERGYELYDPSPNFVELPHSAGGRLSGEQHLLPKKKRGGGGGMSSSMPDEVIGAGIGGAVASSLQPSTASAASSNASSSRQPSLKRVVADTFRNRGYGLLSRFNHKRSGSNASHKSNISNAPSSSSNSNLTSHPASIAMVSMGGQPNLGTIESGGSGSAGSYSGTPTFYTPCGTTSSAGNGTGSTAVISDNPNYKQLDESVTSGEREPGHSLWAQQLTTSSLNPNYELMQPPAANSAATAPFGLLSNNLNYVLMSDPPSGPTRPYTSDNPNYAPMSTPGQLQHSSSDDNENEDEDDDDADEHTELSRRKLHAIIKPQQQQQQQQQPRSRSVSQTRKAETPTALEAAVVAGNTSNILKENWLRQASTPRPPPPNGFIGREA